MWWLFAAGALAAAVPAGALAQQVTVSDPSPGDLVPPRPPPPSGQLYLGASITTNSPGWNQVLRRSDAKGALVLLVVPASPAELIGLVPGDVIVGIENHKVSSDEQAVTSLRSTASNDPSVTAVSPDGRPRTVIPHLQLRAGSSLSDFEQQRLRDDPSLVNRFVYARGQRDPKTAIAVLDQLIDKLPGFAAAHALRSQRLLELAISENDRSPDRLGAIRAAIDKAIELEPESLMVNTTAVGVLSALGDGAEAERHAAEAVAIDDESAQAHHLLGVARMSSRRPSEALPDLHRAVELDPYAQAPYRDLSACYAALGRRPLAKRTDEALAELRTGGRSTPSTAPGQPWAVAFAALAAVVVGAVPLARWRRHHTAAAGRVEGVEPSLRRPGMWVVEALAAVALVSIALPAVGHRLALSPGGPLGPEIADHLVPGVAVLVLCGLAMRLLLRGEQSSDYFFVMAIATVVAGLWTTTTHVALLADALRRRTTAGIALVHCIPGPITIVLGICLYRACARTPVPRATPPRARRPVAQRARPPASPRR